MRIWKTFTGDGERLLDGEEYPVAYRIEAYRDANARGARGVAEGLEIPAIMALLASNKAELRMAEGKVVMVAFLGGQVHGPQRFVVNSPLDN